MQAKHVMTGGSSGGGKTTYLRELHDLHDGISILCNYDNPRASGFEGFICNSFEEMIMAVRNCGSEAELRNLRIDYRGAYPGVDATREPMHIAKKVGEEFNSKICTQIIVDEAQHALPDDENRSSVESGNPLAWGLHQGRDLNIKCVVATQDVSDLYYTPLKNCAYFVWVGKVKSFHDGFLRYWKFNELSLPTENHRYVVINPTKPASIVYRGETKKRYG